METARRYARRAWSVPLTSLPTSYDAAGPVWLQIFEGLAAWLRDDARSAAAVADRVAAEIAAAESKGLPGYVRSAFAFQLSYFNLLLGRLNIADTQAARIEKPVERAFAHLRIAMASGDPSRISRVLDRDYPKLDDAAAVASAVIKAGRLEDARRALDILRKRPNAGGTFANFIEGQLAREDGNTTAAVELIQSHLTNTRAPFEAQTLARILSARGDDARAVEVLEAHSEPRHRLVARPGLLARDWLALRDELAMLYRKVGRHEDANVVETELRALLAVADEDHPIKRRLEQQGRRMH